MRKIVLNKDELYQLYIVQNLGIKDIARIYNVYSRVVKRNLEEYNINKSAENYKEYRKKVALERAQLCAEKFGGNGFASLELKQKAENTMLSRYGNKEIGFKNRDTLIKALNTIQQKYNVSTISKIPEVKQKITETTIKHYGVIRAIQLQEFKDKVLDTRRQRYDLKDINKKARDTYYNKTGFRYPSQNPEIIENIKIKNKKKRKFTDNKIKNTIEEKYDREYIGQLNLSDYAYNILKSKDSFVYFIDSLNDTEKDIYLIAHKLNVHYQTIITYLRKYNIVDKVKGYGSSFEKEIKAYLDSLNIIYNRRDRKIISPYELDFFIPEHKLAIECNGTYYHSIAVNKDKSYHYRKSKLCEELGIRLIHIFEYEWNNERQRSILKNIIKSALGLNKTIYARKLNIAVKTSKEMKQFFEENNIQGFRGGKFAICLIDSQTNIIYMSYLFGDAFFGKGKYQYEVIRGATLLGYNVIGGASKIWNYFIKTYNPQSCVYYIDYNYFNGNSLPYLGLKYITTQPSFKNWFVKENKVKNRDPMHHKEIKELEKQGLVYAIYNAGTKVYIWKK